MIELNLLPDVKKEFIKAQRTRNTVISVSIIVTIAAGVILALLFSAVSIAQPLIINNQTDSIKKAEADLKAIPEIDKYLTVQNQLSHIDGLHSELYLYSRGFDYLQRLNPSSPNNVALSSVVFSKETNTVEIQGVTNDFKALNVFQDTLQNAKLTYKLGEEETTVNLFDQVILQEAGLTRVNNTSYTSFKFELAYPPEAFMKSIKEAQVTVPNLVLSDAGQNAPKEIFGAEPEETE